MKGNPQLTMIKGDMRDQAVLDQAMTGADVVIHLACISNDPSFELNPIWVNRSTTTRLVLS